MKQDLYQHRAEVVKALAHPLRLAIIDLLSADEERCVCELVEALDCDQPSLSKHLAILKNVGVITSRREGTKALYQLRTPCIKNCLDCIDRVIREDFRAKEQELGGLVADE